MLAFNRASQYLSAARCSSGTARVRSATSAFIRRMTCTLVAPQKQISSKARRRRSSPRGIWNHHPQLAVAVAMRSDVEVPLTQAQQQVLDLVERLNRRGWIIDRRRQCPDGYVHEQPDRIFGVLFEGAASPN